MATRLQPKFQQDDLEYKANRTILYKMPRDRPYRRIMLFCQITVKGGGTTAPAGLKTDGFKNLIKKIQFIRNGSDHKIHISAISKYYMDYYQNGVKPAESAIPTVGATGSKTYWLALNLDFASRPRDRSDFSALQPVRGVSSLHLGIQWGDIDDIYTTPNGATIDEDNTFINISQLEAFSNSAANPPGDPGLKALLENALDFRQLEQTATIVDKEYDSFGLNELRSIQGPTPSLKTVELTRAIKNFGEDDWTHSNEVITHWALANIQGGGEPIFRARWIPWWASMRQDYMMDDQPVGIVLQPWANLRQGGLRNVRVESLENKYLTKAPASGKENAIITAATYLAGAPEDAV